MKTNDNKAELLAPAGSIAAMKAVIAAGADAVYIGGTRFGARAYAENPEEADLLEAIDYAHLRGVKVYLTVNTLLKEEELKELPAYLAPFYERGLDAVLVQDFGVLSVIREHFPLMPIHASTQMTVTGPYSARLLKSFGVTRVVPARELSLPELRRIREESGLEVEAFVHGALCVCYSGRCLLSGMLGGRSGNRGRCAQPCRLAYEGPGGRSGDLISPKDLCTIDHVGEMLQAGIASFKIEGRMKQPEYAAGVVSIYRKYMDAPGPVSREDRRTLMTLYNRDGFTDGYLHRHNGREMMAFKRPALTPKEEQARKALYEEMNTRYVRQEKKVLLSGKAELFPGRPARVTLADGTVYEGAQVQTADNVPLTAERVKSQLMKTGGTDFVFEDLEVRVGGPVFMPVKLLNDLRRAVLEGEREKLLAPFRRTYLPPAERTSLSLEEGCTVTANTGELAGSACEREFAGRGTDNMAAANVGQTSGTILETNPAGQEADSRPTGTAAGSAQTGPVGESRSSRGLSVTVTVETEEQLRIAAETGFVTRIAAPVSLFAKMGSGEIVKNIRNFLSFCKSHGKKAVISLPYIERSEKESLVAPVYAAAKELAGEGLDGFLTPSFESMSRLCLMGLSNLAIADAAIYTYNSRAQAFLRELGVTEDTVPAELNRREIMGRDNSASELTVYGREVLMVTAQCLAKNTTGCTGASPLLSLKDRKGTRFPVRCDCVFCLNKLYNSVPTSLLDEETAVRRVAPASVRLAFTTEDAGEMAEVLEAFREGFIYRMKPAALGERTKGHWARGVE